MPQTRAEKTRRQLIHAATEAIRREGYAATSVDQVCAAAGVSKGAFFHHFQSKEDLVQVCLRQWGDQAAALESSAPFQSARTPRHRVLGYLDFYISLFENPAMYKSCLAGTTVQEVGDSIPALRDAAGECFRQAADRLRGLLDEAFAAERKPGRSRKPDTASLAALWLAALQGALILHKASGDDDAMLSTLRHVRSYIESLLPVSSVTVRAKGKRK